MWNEWIRSTRQDPDLAIFAEIWLHPWISFFPWLEKKKTCWWWGHIYIFYTFHQLLHSIFSCGINLFAFLCQDRSFTENKVSDLFSKTFHDMFCPLFNDTRKIGQYREARIAIAPIEKSSACPPLDILDPLLNIRKGMAVSPDWYLQRLMWT